MIRTISYDKALYSRDALYSARDVYLRYGDITIDDESGVYVACFSADEDTLDQLIGEFSNYLIYIEATQEL